MTEYEMRISGWSSDVCSSDLLAALARHAMGLGEGDQIGHVGSCRRRGDGGVLNEKWGPPRFYGTGTNAKRQGRQNTLHGRQLPNQYVQRPRTQATKGQQPGTASHLQTSAARFTPT